MKSVIVIANATVIISLFFINISRYKTDFVLFRILPESGRWRLYLTNPPDEGSEKIERPPFRSGAPEKAARPSSRAVHLRLSFTLI
jgi:hypothetical protein